MKSRIYRYIALAVTVVPAAIASAQTLDESLTVEGTYRPNVIPADRLPLVPDLLQFSAPENRMQFDQSSVTADFAPDALTMPATEWRRLKNYSTTRGYLDFRLGSWLNSSLSAGYAPVRNETTTLNVWLQHNSTSLRESYKKDPDIGVMFDGPRIFRYDETLGVDLSRVFNRAGRLNADVRYHLGYFNYYMAQTGIDEKDERYKSPSQTVNDMSVSLMWAGDKIGKFSYNLNADASYYAYRRDYYWHHLYQEYTHEYEFDQRKGQRETVVNVGGTGKYDLSGGKSSVELGILYSGVVNYIGDNVNRIQATPAYIHSFGNTSIRVGVNMAAVDSKFRVAPDVRLTAATDKMAFTAALGGGTHLRTVAWRRIMDYYDDPAEGCVSAAYTPIEARLALQLNPGGRWTAGVEGLFRNTLNESGWGQYAEELSTHGKDFGYNRIHIHGFSVAVNAGYEFCKAFALKAKAAWQPQHGNIGILNGFDRPAVTADLSATSNPIDKLSMRLDYQMRVKRQTVPWNNIHRLNFKADYRITDRITVGAELNNILNNKDEALPWVSLDPLNFAVGAQLTF